MSEIYVTALLRIADGMLEEFKEFCSTIVAKIRADEAGNTITYSFYLDESDPSICFVHERYANAEAFSKHAENMSSTGQASEHLFSIERCDICGQLTLEQALAMKEFARAGNIRYTNFNYICTSI
jgi:quinol monooxygenase YgiN